MFLRKLEAPKHQRGFSMIELLVTILIFAVGLLGIASLQKTGMRMARDADLMGQASMMASSMADRIRSIDMASWGDEVDDWDDEISDSLPNGSGAVVQNGNIFTISVTWTESADSSEADNIRTYDLVVRL